MSILWNNLPAVRPALVAAIVTLCFSPAPLLAWQETDPEQPPTRQQESEPQTDDDSNESEPTEKTLDDSVRDAIALANQGKYDDAIAQVEGLRKEHPEDQRLPMFMVRLLNARITELLEEENRAEADKYIARSAALAREVVNSTPEEGDQLTDVKAFLSATIYNEACSLALSGDSESAMACLEEAFQWGYDDFEFASSDSDLASVSDSDAFRELVETQKQLLMERLKVETATQLAEFESYDFDFDLPTFDEETVSLTDFKGKVLIVDFWGTWCPPCRAEIPSFIKLKQQHSQRGLDVIGLTYERGEDDQENVENVKTFMDEFELNYQCVMGTDEVMDQVPEFQGYPTTLFIDRTGTVRLQMVGLHSYQKLESVCEALLAEQPSSDQ